MILRVVIRYFLTSAVFGEFIWVTANNGPPKLSSTYQRRFAAQRGDTVRFTCPIELASRPGALFAWFKGTDMIHDGWVRHRILNVALKIKDLELTDSGIYVCQATNGFGTAQASFTLYVYDANRTAARLESPTANFSDHSFEASGGMHGSHQSAPPEEPPQFADISEMRYNRQISLPVGASARLDCKTTGNPPPEVVWYKDDVPFKPEIILQPSTLELFGVTQRHSGKYTCLAYNNLGAVNFTFTVHVLRDHTVNIKEARTVNLSVTIGETVELRCPFRSSSAIPRIQWLKRMDTAARHDATDAVAATDQRPVNETTFEVDVSGQRFVSLNDARKIQLVTYDNGFYVSLLTVTNATKRDAGLYVCSTVGAMTSSSMNLRSMNLGVFEEQKRNLIQSPTNADPELHSSPFVAVATSAAVIITVSFLLAAACISSRRNCTQTSLPQKMTAASGCGSQQLTTTGKLHQVNSSRPSTVSSCDQYYTTGPTRQLLTVPLLHAYSGGGHRRQQLHSPAFHHVNPLMTDHTSSSLSAASCSRTGRWSATYDVDKVRCAEPVVEEHTPVGVSWMIWPPSTDHSDMANAVHFYSDQF